MMNIGCSVFIPLNTPHDPDADLKVLFEAVNEFDKANKEMAKKVFQGHIIQNQAKRWSASD